MIKSAIEIIHNKKFQCAECVKKISPSVRENRMNCTGKIKKEIKFDGFQYDRCPGNFYNPGYAQLLDVHRMFKNGVLAYPGGLMDQPAKYIETMNLIENITNGKELERIKNAAAANKQGARRGRK